MLLLFSPAEEALVNTVFDQLRIQSDVLQADQATEIFLKTGLHHRVLANIWDIADESTKGYLIRREVAITLRLIGWAQLGRAITLDLVNQEGPLANLQGQDLAARSPIRVGSTSVHATSWNLQLRSLPRETKTSYQAAYFEAGPRHGVLSAEKVWQILLKSQLDLDTLQNIWKLVDTQNRGDLDVVEFTIAMYIVHGLVQHEISTIPSSLPSWIYEQAGGRPPRASSPGADRTKELNRAFAADFWTLQFRPEDNTTLERVSRLANHYFNILDRGRRQYIEGDDVVSFMSLSKLPLQELGHIWDIADPDQKGHLDREAFAYALLLIYRKLAGIQPHAHPPPTPPPTLETLPPQPPLPTPSPRTFPSDASPNPSFLSPPPPFRARSSSPGSNIESPATTTFTQPAPRSSQSNGSSNPSSLTPPPTFHRSSSSGSSVEAPSPHTSTQPAPRTPQFIASSDRSPLSPPPTFRARSSSSGSSVKSPPPPAPPPLRPRKSSIAKTRTPTQQDEVERLLQENRLLRTQSVIIPEATSQLLSEIGELRALLQQSQPSTSSPSYTKPTPKKRKEREKFVSRDDGDLSDGLIFEELWKELEEKDATITFLRRSLDNSEETSRQNELLQAQVDDLKREIQMLRSDRETVRQMVNEEAQRELEALRRQVDELRQSTAQVPSSGGDEELQMLINEELSRENSTLRSKVSELQESLSQVQRLSEEQDTHRRAAEELARRHRRLQRRHEEAAAERSRVEQELRNRVAELERDVASRRQQHSRSDSHEGGPVPPPAYTETA